MLILWLIFGLKCWKPSVKTINIFGVLWILFWYAFGPPVSGYHPSCTDIVAGLLKAKSRGTALSDIILCWVVALEGCLAEIVPQLVFSNKALKSGLLNESIVLARITEGENVGRCYDHCHPVVEDLSKFHFWRCLKILNTTVCFLTFYEFGITKWHWIEFSLS